MAKEINLNLKKEEMDTIINQQKAEKSQPQLSKEAKQYDDVQQMVQAMQFKEMELRLNLMNEELISKQISNILAVSNAITQITDEKVSGSLKTLLSGYAIDKSK